MQLVAYGAQDIYLTGNPQITFFKVVYRRHTNFAMEAIEQTWNGSSTVDGRCTATISRNGDLVHRMYLEVNAPNVGNTGNVCNVGAAWITDVELEIGGQKIDKQTGLWMELWAELTEPNPTGATGSLVAAAIAGGTLFQKMSGMGGVRRQADGAALGKLYIPLQFWFCRNPGLALPLIALQYHEVKVILNHNIATNLAEAGAATNSLFCDYIYLDTDERRRFAQVSHEYLIEQVQEGSLTAGVGDLNFNHPVKELVWCDASKLVSAATGVSTPIGTSNTGKFTLKLNGHERFAPRDWRYFSRVQVWQHHTGAGGLNSANGSAAAGQSGDFDDSIGVYSFALKPEEHQPSGTCNFSRIDNARLEATGAAGVSIDTIFAVNYNVLRIMSGMGGLAYSN